MAGNLIPSTGPQSLEPHQDHALQPGGGFDMAPPDTSDGINWGRYISALKRYRWFMLMVVLLGTGIGVGITRFIDPEYVARSTLWLASAPGKSGPVASHELVGGNAWLELLRSFAVIDTVVLKQSLFVQPNSIADSAAFRGFSLGRMFRNWKFKLIVDKDGKNWDLATTDGSIIDHGAVGDSIGRKVGFRWAPTKRQLGRDRTIKFEVISPREASSDLLARFSASMAQESNFLRLSLRDIDPGRAAEVLNAIDSQFVGLAADLKKKQIAELSIILKSQLDTVSRQLEAAEDALKNFQIRAITQPGQELAISGGSQQTGVQATGIYIQQKMNLDQVQKDRETIEEVLGRLKTGESTVDAF
ncbi:MAG: hypothetical protein ABI836_12330, partial [Gemmatimonadota bacterium]